jgi:hypothetical protein
MRVGRAQDQYGMPAASIPQSLRTAVCAKAGSAERTRRFISRTTRLLSDRRRGLGKRRLNTTARRRNPWLACKAHSLDRHGRRARRSRGPPRSGSPRRREQRKAQPWPANARPAHSLCGVPAGVPHCAQNFAVASSSCPQPVQKRLGCASAVPHSAQNFPPGCFVLHLPQMVTAPPGEN